MGHAKGSNTAPHDGERGRHDHEDRAEDEQAVLGRVPVGDEVGHEMDEHEDHAAEKQDGPDAPGDLIALLVAPGTLVEERLLESEPLGPVVIDKLVERVARGVPRLGLWDAPGRILDQDPLVQVACRKKLDILDLAARSCATCWATTTASGLHVAESIRKRNLAKRSRSALWRSSSQLA